MKNHVLRLAISILFALLVNLKCYTQNKSIKTAGDIGLILVPVAAFATTLIKDDKRGTWQFTKGLALNQVLTYGLKLGINKSRPDFSDNNSFPSGHTSTAFQAASFLHKRYGFKQSIPAYALAGFTAFSRLDAKKHDGWDILAGTIIGIGSTYIFTTEYQKKHIELTINSSKGNYRLGFIYKF